MGIKLPVGVKLPERGDCGAAALKFLGAGAINRFEPWSFVVLSPALAAAGTFDAAMGAYGEFLGLRPE